METDLDIFGKSDSVREQADAISSLMKQKKLHQAAKSLTFDKGLETLARFASDDTPTAERLVAIANLVRIGTLVKPLQERIASLLRAALATAPGELELLDDPDDRTFVASLWRHVKTPWLSEYLAKAAVNEEGSDRVRDACLEGLLELNDNLAATLGELSLPLRRLSFSTEKRGDSKAKRVRRILASLRAAYATSTKDPGDDSGVKFKSFLIDCFVHDGLPEKVSLLDDVAEESLRVVHQFIRSRFPLATSDETYSALDVIKGWYRDADWSRFTETSDAASLLVRDLASALEIRVRFGLSDDRLFSRLVLATGSQSRARAGAKELLDRLPGLPEDLAQWLSGLPPRRKSALATESQTLAFDEGLGDLIINGQRLRESAERVRDDALPEIGVMSPQAAAPIEVLLGVARSMVNALEAMAKARELSIKGNPGDIVEFSPLEHEMVGGATPGVRLARLLRPAVEGPGAAGGRRVLRKALVEAAE